MNRPFEAFKEHYVKGAMPLGSIQACVIIREIFDFRILTDQFKQFGIFSKHAPSQKWVKHTRYNEDKQWGGHSWRAHRQDKAQVREGLVVRETIYLKRKTTSICNSLVHVSGFLKWSLNNASMLHGDLCDTSGLTTRELKPIFFHSNTFTLIFCSTPSGLWSAHILKRLAKEEGEKDWHTELQIRRG